MTPEELREAFRQQVPMLEAFGKWVTERVIHEVQVLLGASYSDYFFKVPPRHRVKDVNGFVEKAFRKGKNYVDPLKEITDQVGTRFVVLLHNQCNIVNQAISAVQEWECVKAKDIENIRLKNPHHFDYESYHWTVTPRCGLMIGGTTVPTDISCEIQVRTLLQHAYAELAHATVYKPRTVAQPKVMRIIARGAALIETTDGVFLNVAEEIEKVTGKVDELLRKCSEWYAVNISPGQYPPSGIAHRIVDAYVENLSKIDWAHVETYLTQKYWIVDAVKENSENAMFDDPIILLVFWLVSELEADIAERWPLELTYLQPVFTRLSISSGDSLF
ncbi:MAG: RelA/SpoT domain-containing protein [Prosthecobacter sp.]